MKVTYQLIIILCFTTNISSLWAKNTNSKISRDAFHKIALKSNLAQSESKTLWLDKNIQNKISQILSHNYPKLRLRYKRYQSTEHQQTVWFLDEIGKERPISFGISIINNQVDLIRVLVFRESRGGEIQMQAFSEQFNQIALNQEMRLNKRIDGITGATMSVSAMKKIARVALMLHQQVTK